VRHPDVMGGRTVDGTMTSVEAPGRKLEPDRGPRPGDPLAVWPGIVLGLVAGAVAIGAAQLVAGLVNPQASPILTVGQAAIDLTPEWLKAWAIRTFGERDKLVLLSGIAVVLASASVALGIASIRRVGIGLGGLVAFGALGVAAAITRPDAQTADVLPAIVGATAAATALLLLRRPLLRSRPPRDPAGAPSGEASPPEAPAAFDRRRFLLASAAGAVLAAVSGGAGNLFARRFRADASRADVRIPAPASAAAPATGAELSVPGLGPYFTPNDRFYRVDTALLVPALMAEDWRLRIHGMVDREITLDYSALLARPLIERDITLACVSNPVGGGYVGNARWVGAPLRELLEEAGVRPGADQIVSRSVDGFTVGTPTAVAMDGRDAMLAVAMNGEPLPIDHGFPVRMLVPGLYGYVSATKWLVDLELTTLEAYDAYWIQRGWAKEAPIKTQSRIDTPRVDASLTAGQVVVAGVAWAQRRGIDRVEIRIDDGPWRETELAAEDTVDTWRQWRSRWEATPGRHRIAVRATDGDGEVQTAESAQPFPDGATGHHTIEVDVA
jgi:DMSO/TMAO reductase YedYZ molybdopterin-dependent catalytic subunit